MNPAGRPSGVAVTRFGCRAWLSLFLALLLSALSSFAAAPVFADATLSALSGITSTDGSVFGEKLSIKETFAAETTAYTATVPLTVTHVRLKPTVSESEATVKVGKTGNLRMVAKGSASTAVELADPSTAIQIEVTAADRVTTKTYTVTVTRQGICNRTKQVRDAIVKRIFEVKNCSGITAAHLAGVPELILTTKQISALKDGDFDGLNGLRTLNLGTNNLTSLPDLSQLTSLQYFWLDNNALISLPDLSQNTKLSYLNLKMNSLTSLPDLSRNRKLRTLDVRDNNLTSLPDLRQNRELSTVRLDNNPLSNLGALTLTESVGGKNIALNETFSGGTTDYTANLRSGVSEVIVTPTAADKGEMPSGSLVYEHGNPRIEVGLEDPLTRVFSGFDSPAITLPSGNDPVEIKVEVEGRAIETGSVPKIYTITLTRLAGKTYSITQTASADEGASARLQVNLGEQAPSTGITFDVAYSYASDASSDDTDTTVSTVTVANNETQAVLNVPLAADSHVENDETFTVSITPASGVTGWTEAQNGVSGTATVTIQDKQETPAKVAFGSDAAATSAYTARVFEFGGSINVPVTVSHLPAASTTFTVQVLSDGTATETDDYTIATKSVTFGPSDSSNTKNVAVTIKRDAVNDELDETIRLRIVPATSPTDLSHRYARDAKGATATIVIDNVVQTADATLSALTGSTSTDGSDFSGTLSFGTFAATTLSYTATVANGVTHVKLTPTVSESNATVKVGKTGSLATATSATASDAIALAVGDNAIEVEVTAQDGTKKTYTVTVTRQPLPPGAPTGLGVAAGDAKLTLTWTAPAADPSEGDVAGYDVHYTSASKTGDSAVADDAVATGNDASAAWVAVSRSGTTASQDVSSLDNSTEYRVRVRSVNGGGNSSWVHGTGTPLSSDATLSALTVNTSTDNSDFSGTLSFGSFAAQTVSYTAAVVNAVTHVKVTATVNESKATVEIGKTGSLATATSGTASGAIALELGDNAIEVKVTAPDGTAKTYTITVTRQSNDAALSALTGSTSTDGSDFSGTLSFGTFAATTLSYTATVANGVTHVKLTPTVNESNAAVKVGKTGTLNTVASGDPSAAIALDVGDNAIKVEVTAQDGTVKTYTVTVTRQPLPPGAPTGLDVAAGDAKLTLTWTAPAASASTGVVAGYDVHYTSDSKTGEGAVADDAVATGNDPASGWVAVSRSGTTASQQIASLDNSTEYRVRVRSVNGGGNSSWVHGTGTPQSSDATLSALTVNTSTDNSDFSGTLSFGVFAAQTVSYTAAVVNAVTHLKVTATVNESKATVEIGKTGTLAAATSATASDAIALELGDNAIEVKVTAQDGTAKTYTITVTRQSNDAALSALTGSTSTDGSDFSGTLSFDTFAATTLSYTATVANGVTHVKLTATVNESNAAVKVGKPGNLNTVASGDPSAAIALDVGDNPIKVEVTAQDGTVKTYTVTVTRQPLPPGAPTGLTVAAGDAKLTLTWTAPAASASTGDVEGYDVHYTSASKTGEGAVADSAAATGNDPISGWVAVSRSGTAVTQEITSLDNGTTYRVRVRASNSGGESAWQIGISTPRVQATLSVADASVSEGDTGTASLTFTVTLSPAADDAVTVDWATSKETSDTATPGTDYVAASGTLSFAAGDTSKTATVTVTGDVVDEPNETLTLTLSNASGAAIDDATATGTITDDDTAPSGITLAASPDTVTENGGAKTVTVTATVNGATRYAAAKTVTVKVGKSADSATEGTDYTTVADLSIEIAAGAASGTKDFTLTPTDDVIDEANETISVEGTSSGVTVTADEITITDDDATPSGTIALATLPANVAESAGSTEVTVTATLPGSTARNAATAVTVKVGEKGTATEGTDYATVADFTLTIAAGQRSGTAKFNINPTQDTTDEGAGETVGITGATSVSGFTVGETSITITDDDGEIALAASPTGVAESAGSTEVTVTATLPGSSTRSTATPVTVKVGEKGTATEGTDYATVADFTLTIAAGQRGGTAKFNINPTQDVIDEGTGETVGITGTTTVSGLTVGETSMTITDDDAAPSGITLAASPDTVTENGGAKTVTVTATVNGATRYAAAKTVTVKVGKSADSATEGTDYATVADLSIEIAAGAASGSKSFTLTPTNDVIDETNETISVEGTSAGVTVTADEITITDDDAAPSGITLVANPDTVTENGGAKTVTVTASVNGTTRYAAAKTVTVKVGKSADSATEGTDYTTVADLSIEIAAGAASGSKSFTLTPTNDALDETNETISMEGTSAGVTVTADEITITDDDAAPSGITLVASPDTVTENGGAKTVTVTATVNGATRYAAAKTVTVKVGKSADSATEGTDYATVADLSISIAAGAASGTQNFTLTPSDDALDETNETISVEGTLSGATVTADQITITDDDTKGIVLSKSAVTVTEASGTGRTESYTVKLATQPSAAVTVAVTSGDTDAATVNQSELSFSTSNWNQAQTVTVTGVDDAIDNDPDRSVNIAHAASGGDYASVSKNLPVTVTDDEGTPTVTLALSPASISENGGTSTVTATLSGASSAAVTVTVSASAVSPAVSGDFTVSNNKTLTIAAGATASSGTVTISAVNNSVDAPNKQVTVSGAASGGGVSNPANQTLTITDDDAAPSGITLVASPDTVTENGGAKTVTVTATVNGATRYAAAKTVTVKVGKSADSATEGTDYATVADLSIEIAAGAASGTKDFTLTPTNDAVDESNETISVEGASAGVTVTADQITITDDDTKGIVLSKTAVTVTEASGTGRTESYTVKLATQPSAAVTVAVTSGDTDAATVNKASLSFSTSNWNSAQTVTVTGVDDAIDNDPDRSVNIAHAASGGDYASVSKNLPVTVTDDEGSASLTVGDASVAEGDSGTASLMFTVTLSPAADGEVTVDWATSKETSDTATPGTDYTAGTGTLTFAAGDTSKTATVTVTGDLVDEPNETLTLTLSNASGAAIGDATATGTITDDDNAPSGITLAASPDTVTENGGAKTVTVTATVNGATRYAAAKTVTVKVGKSADSATEGTDYATVADLSISIAAGAASGTQNFTLTPSDDALDETNETISVEGTLSGATVTADQITITDDDTKGIVLSKSAVTVTEASGTGRTESYTVKLATQPSAAVTVAVTSGDTDAATVNQSELSFSTSNWNQAQTVTVTGVDDAIDNDPDRSVNIAHAASGGDYASVSKNLPVTVTDDEGTPTVTLALSPASISENGGTSTVTATLSGASSAAVTVTVSASAVSPAVSGDFTVSNNKTLTIAAGATASSGTVTISAVNNSVDAPNKQVTVSGAASGGGVSNPANQTLTITDDDAAPSGITLAASPDTVTENGGAKTVTVTATVNGATRYAAAKTVAVKVGKSADSATEDTDYATVAELSIEIAAGAASGSKSFTLTPTNDDLDEANETISVEGTSSGVTTVTADEITITDDDTKGIVLSKSAVTVTEASGSGRTESYTVKLATQPTAAVTVAVASGDTDAATVNQASLSFSTTNWNQAQTVTVTGVDDAIDNDPDRSVNIAHAASGGDYASVSKNLPVTVTDDEGSASLTVGDASVAEGDTGTASLTFTVTLSPAADGEVTVDWATSKETSDTAAPGTDYTAGSGTLTFAAGDTSKTVTVTVTGDLVDEPNETLTLTLSNASGAAIGDATATGTITDDDNAPSGITLAASPDTVTENGGAKTVTVNASVNGATRYATAKTVAVKVGKSADSATEGTDYTTVADLSIEIAAGAASGSKRFTLTPTNDALDESNETISVEGASAGVTVTADQITITDDDTKGIVLSKTAVTVTEASGTGRTESYTVKLATQPSAAVTVAVTSGDTDAATVNKASLSFSTSNWNSAQTVTVTGVDDAIDNDPDRSVNIAHAASGGDYASVSKNLPVTVTDDEGSASLTVGDASVAEGDSGTASLMFTVTLSPAADGEVTVDWATSKETSDTATPGTDYTAGTGTLTFAAGDTSKTATVTVTGDLVDEPNETLTLTLSNASGAAIGDATATGTITDDDNAPSGITLAASPDTVTENGGAKTVTVTASVNGATRYATAKTVAVKVGKSADSATEGTDYATVADLSISIAAGAASGTQNFTLTPTDDDLDESNETISVEGASSGVTVTADQITITDDDTKGIVLSKSAVTVTEASGTGRTESYTVKLATQPSAAVTVAVSSSDTDAATVNKASLSFSTSNWNVAQTVTVTGVDDSIDNDPDRTATVSHSASGGDYASVSKNLTVTVTDDEGAATLSVANASVAEGDTGTASLTFTVTLSPAADDAVTVDWATSKEKADSATPGTDYTAGSGTLSFAAGETSKTATVTVTGDVVDEPNETLTLTLSNASGAAVGTAAATGTITDDDSAPSGITLVASPDTVTENGGAKTVTVTASVNGTTRYAAAKTVAVTVGKSADSATEGTDYSNVGNLSISIAAGAASGAKDFTLTPTDDALDESNETISVEGTSSGVTVTAEEITITDDDTKGIVLSRSAVTVTEASGTTNSASYTVKLASQPTAAVAVAVASGDTNTATVNKASLSFSTSNWNVAQTVTVTGVDDSIDNTPERTATVSHSASGGDYGSVSKDLTVTVTDDESTPTVTLALGSASISENGGTSTVTAMLSRASSAAVTVTVSANAVSPAVPGDFSLSTNKRLTIAAGETSSTGTVTITANNNNVDAPNKTVTVSATASGGGVSNPSNKTLTITDDESTPTVTLALGSASISENGGSTTVTATLSGTSSAAVTVTVSVTAVSPATSSDYTISTNKELSIAAGSTSSTGTVTITAVDNSVDTANKTVTVSGASSGGNGVSNPGNKTLTITDDDAPMVTLVLTPSSISESGGSSTVTATLSTAASAAVTVTVSASAVSPAVSGDFNLSTNTTLTIAAGNTASSGTVTITAVNNSVDAPNKTVTVSGSASGGGVTGPSNQTLTITDDDGTPTVTLELSSASISENGGTSTVTAELSHASSAAVTVTVSASAVSPAVSGDFSLTTNKVLTIAAGSTTSTGTVTITANNNSVDAPNKTVTVSGVASGGSVSNPANKMLTITDDESTPTVTLELSSASISESGGTSTVTATLSGASSAAVTVMVSATAVSPATSSDFTITNNKTLTIAAGSTASTGTVTITAVNNSVDAPNKTVTVSATASGGGVSNPSNKTLTITDDENTPTVTLALGSASISENGGSTTVTATLSGASSAAVTVTVSVTAVSPAISNDYTISANKDLTIAAGSTSSTGTVTITAVDNSVDAANKTVTVSGAASGGNGVSNPSSQTLTITDDDAPVVTLVLTPSSISESGGSSTVTATLSTAASAAVTVTVSASAVSPATSSDFSLSTNKDLTIAAGSTSSSGTVTITAVNNSVDAPNKTVTVSATASGGGVSNPANKTLTITDDDGVPTVTLELSSASISENGGTSTVTAALSHASSAAVTVTVSASAVSPATSSDFTITNNKVLTIAAGATASTGTVTITAANNSVDAPNKTVTVSGVASGGSVSNPANKTLTITDDESTPTVTLSLGSASISENGGTSNVTATLSAASSAAVTVTVSASAVSPATSSDFTITNNKTLTIAAGSTASTGTVTITAANNSVDAPNKTVTVSATASGGGVSNPSSKTLTITDDESTPTVTLALGSTSISENGGSTTVTATLSGTSSAAVTVTVSVTAVSPATSGDYTISANKALTIAAGSTSSTGTVTITAVNNSVDTANKTVTVSGASSGGNGVSNPSSKTLTITDDDAPMVTIVLTPSSISESGGSSTVTATLSTASSAAVTVTVSASAVSPAVSGDFNLSTNTTLTIAAGNTSSSGTVTITAVNNSVDAANKTVTVSGSATGGGVTGPSNQTLTITDDDGVPTVTLSLSPTSISESGGTSTVTAALSHASSAAVTVTVSASAVSPAVSGDFSLTTNKVLTIAAGSTASTGTVTITANNNSVDAPNKTVTVSGVASGGGVSNPSSQTLTITDDDGTPTVTLVLSPSSISESGGISTVTATLSGASSAAVTVTVATTAVSPATSNDITITNNKTLTIAAGSTASSGTVTITAVDNSVDAANKTVTVSGVASGGGVSNPSSQTLTITDDDSASTVSLVLSPTSISESGGSSTVTATLSSAASSAVTVTVSATAVSPATSSDYTISMNKDLTIAAGSTSSTGTVTITAVDNSVDAANKTVMVSGVASGGGVSNPSSQTLTITDDDNPGVTVSTTSLTVTEGSSITYTVNLDTLPSASVTVRLSSSDTGAISFSPALLTFTVSNWGEPQTVSVFGLGDSDTDDESATISHAVSSGDSNYGASLTVSSVQVSVTDDDESQPTETETEMNDSASSAYLEPVGRTVTDQVVDAVGERTTSPRQPGVHATLAGQNMPFWQTQTGTFEFDGITAAHETDYWNKRYDPVRRTHSPTTLDILTGTSFGISGESTSGGLTSMWGQGVYKRFKRVDDGLNVSGSVSTAMMGVDWSESSDTESEWLAGLAVARSRGKGSYSGDSGEGQMESTVTGVYPYVSRRLSERLSGWATVGRGKGKYTLKSQNQTPLSTDLSMIMAAAGLNGTLTPPKGNNLSLALKADARFARTKTDAAASADSSLNASKTDVWQLRAGLTGSKNTVLGDGEDSAASMKLSFELGARLDGGDAQKGYGIDLGGGIFWTNPKSGLTADLKARTLVVHREKHYREWGASALLEYDPNRSSEYGVSASLRQYWGASPQGGMDALLSSETLPGQTALNNSSQSQSESSDGRRTEFEAGYGIPVLDGTFTGTPNLGMSLSDDGASTQRLGWRLTAATSDDSSLEFNVGATRSESADGTLSHDYGAQLRAIVRW